MNGCQGMVDKIVLAAAAEEFHLSRGIADLGGASAVLD